MAGWRRSVAAVVVGLLAVSGCSFRRVPPTAPAAPAVDNDDHLAWAEGEPYAVVVRKSCRTLDIYHYGTRIRSFPAVFGLNRAGSKQFEGDLRTPTGLYMI